MCIRDRYQRRVHGIAIKLAIEKIETDRGILQEVIEMFNRLLSEKGEFPSKGNESRSSRRHSVDKTQTPGKNEKLVESSALLEYTENVFNKEDFFLYRGVIQFYLGQYKEAEDSYQIGDRKNRNRQRHFAGSN
eukprot:TRINITY_DN45009_c0_g1_i1.p2 TRINITY_DN45009_c0_g1~~TRINITY_DN45009_c0_g1_i1.p2  ORF type:complete len:133 (-),score=29.28 TRINITY_DN45009_c0_g1_i1:252-650(-)